MSTGLDKLAARILALRRDGDVYVIGLTGSVASGKTTLAGALASHMGESLTVETVSTDGFLFPNTVLAERGHTQEKGFPHTYDREALAEALIDLRAGAAEFPTYSHITFDVDPLLARQLERPDVLIVEGLGFAEPSEPPRGAGEPDVLVYLDAELADIEHWYVERFVRFWKAAEDDPASFYAQFLHMSEPELRTFAMSVWTGINLPNLENHILPMRDVADIIVKKDREHSVSLVEDRT